MMTAEMKALAEEIRTAVKFDRILPPVFRNRYRCPLGAFHRPEVEEIIDDQLNGEGDDRIYKTRENYEIWIRWQDEYRPRIKSKRDRRLVWLRCGGAGWAKVGELLQKERKTYTVWKPQTLIRHFRSALKEILEGKTNGQD